MASAELNKTIEEKFKGLDNLKVNRECNQFLDFAESDPLTRECAIFLDTIQVTKEDIAEMQRKQAYAGETTQEIKPSDYVGERTEEIDLVEVNGAYHSKRTA